MVQRFKKLPKYPSSRNLLPYFLESKIWSSYEERVTNNPSYWVAKEPNRAREMYAAYNEGHKGYTVQQYIYDMMECAMDDRFKKTTQDRLYKELDELEDHHAKMDTLYDMVGNK